MIVAEGPLFGTHLKVVEQLIDRFNRLRTGDPERSNVVILEAPSGFGKSRIIREFYDRIRMTGPAVDGYWPALHPESEQQVGGFNVGPLPQRKVLGPDPDSFVWQRDALPTFGWWTFNCELIATGDSVGLDSEATDQLNAHSLALTISRNKQRGLKGLGGAALASIIDEAKAFGRSELEGVGLESIQTLIGGVVGLGLWVQLSKSAVRAGQNASNQRKKLKSRVDVGDEVIESRLSRAKSLAKVLTDLTAAGLPAVVVLEDAHRMGKDLREMLDALPVADPNHPVMVVATVWPEGADNEEYKAWSEAALTNGRAVRIGVPRLSQHELAELIHSYYPKKISKELAFELARRIESPYIAKLWLTTRKIHHEIEFSTNERDLGKVLLGDSNFPANILQIYEQRWAELPEGVRNALILAAYATPRDEETAKYIPLVVDQASRCVDITAAGGLAQSVTPFAWSRVEGSLNIMRELLMTQVAQKYGREILREKEIRDYHQAVSHASGAWLLSNRSPGVPQERAAQIVAAKLILNYPDGRTPAEERLAYIVVAEVFLRTDNPQKAYKLLKLPVSDIGKTATDYDDELLALYSQAAESINPRQAAIAGERRESLALERSAPSDHVLWTRVQAAWSHALVADDDAQQWPTVLSAYKELLSDIGAEFGQPNKIYMAALHDYTQVLLASGNRVVAVTEYRKLITLMGQVFGANHPATLDARFEFVQYTGRNDSATEMIPLVRDLARDLQQRYGRFDHRTIKTRLALAHWRLRTARDRTGLLPEIDDIIKASGEANGPTQIDTLMSRAAHSIYLSRENEEKGGLREASDLLGTARLVFGHDAPETRYFLWLEKNARSYIGGKPLKVLPADSIRLAPVSVTLAADAVSVATALYPVFREDVPKPSPEAMRSKVLTDFSSQN